MHSVKHWLDLIKSTDYGRSKITPWSVWELWDCGNDSFNNGDLNISSEAITLGANTLGKLPPEAEWSEFMAHGSKVWLRFLDAK